MLKVKERSGLFIEQMYTGCLSEAAYYIESNGEAAIIDPMRETSPYLELAAKRGAKIKYIFETHFHADFVSGHIDLAKRTGAQIIYGPMADTAFDVIVAEEGQIFELGAVKFEVLHTPGHTMESSCYVLYDEENSPHAVFTGDTLFIGEVGRPDLAQKGEEITMEDLAGFMYDSLRNKIMTLPDHVLVYPAHGAGSACGKNISDEKFSTIGSQKQSNYALQPMEKEEFIKVVTADILPPPQYFPKNAMLNKQGYADIDEVLEKNSLPLTMDQVDEVVAKGAIIIDTRKPLEFGAGHIPGSLFFGLDGSFASWVGTLVEDLNQSIIVVTAPGREKEAVLRLARVGYHNSIGYVENGVEGWKAAGRNLDHIKSITPEEFEPIYHADHPKVLDVRKPSEFETSHVKDAILYPLDFITDHFDDLEKEDTYYVHCRSGYRSMVAASLMRRQGYANLINVDKGFTGISNTAVETTT